jgi:hypothetical protein
VNNLSDWQQKNSSTLSGMEKFLFRTASDKDFRDSFLRDRKSFLENSNFSLSHQDKMILSNIPLKNLSDMIEKLGSRRSSRRNFLKGAAAGALFLTGAVSSSFAGEESDRRNIFESQTLGSRPDYPCNFSYDMPQPLTRTVGPQGDTIVYDYTGLGIIIPPGALYKQSDITINILYMGPGLNEKNNFFHLDVYRLSSQDSEFSKDITIWFPAVNHTGIKAYFYKDQMVKTCADDVKLWTNKEIWNSISDESVWETIPVEIKENYYAVFKTKKCGIYTAGYFK